MGYMYYGNYAEWYEIGRVEALRSLGVSYKTMEDEWHAMLPVVHMECRYLRPALYDDVVRIESSIRKIPDSNISFHHELFNEERNELLHHAKVKLVFVDPRNMQRCTAPEAFMELIKPFF